MSPDADTIQYLDPFTDPQHRYRATYARTVTVAKGQVMEVAITHGPPGSNGACDWSWVRDIRFIPTTNLTAQPNAAIHPLRY